MDYQQYQLFPPLTEEEYEALKADIAIRGVQVPVVIDETGAILDGFHRVRICEELGIKDYPKLRCMNLSHEQKIEQALNLNLLRRHLTLDQRDEIVTRLRGEGWSTRRIAEKLNVSQSTIARSVSGEPNGSPTAIVGKDGKSYPASIITRTASEDKRVQRALALVEPPKLEPYADAQDLFRAARLAKVEAEHQALGPAPALTIQTGPFTVLYADPPWKYEAGTTLFRWSIENHYPTMTVEDLCLLPVESLGAENSVLFLWATSPKLAEALGRYAGLGLSVSH
jgi:predicted transcriptional regulator